MAENSNFLDNVVDWLQKGYPEGVPPKDYYPLLALLKRSLTEDEVKHAASSILRSGDMDTPVTEEQIQKAIHDATERDANPEELHQVASRLASVGWPLAAPAR